MQAIKAIFIGLPKHEIDKYSKLVARVKADKVDPVDYKTLESDARRNIFFKLVSLPIVYGAATAVYIPPDFFAPIVAKMLVGIVTYRLLNVPSNLRSLTKMKEFSLKYDLENNPELLNNEKEVLSYPINREKIDTKNFADYNEDASQQQENKPNNK